MKLFGVAVPTKIRDALTSNLRVRAIETAHFGIDLALSKIQQKAGVQRPLRVLLASDGEVYTSEQQFAPLLAARPSLRRRGVVIHKQLISDVLRAPKALLAFYDAVGVKLGFRTPAPQAHQILQTLREKTTGRLVFFDGDDDLCIQWPGVLPLVDLYVKKHGFRDRSEYTKERIGKTNLTDYVARTFGVSFETDIISSSQPVAAADLHKIVIGWNVAADDKIRALYASVGRSGLDYPKDLDVVCRATIDQKSWIAPLRSVVIDRLSAMANQFKVLTPAMRVAQDEYNREMLRSRICISPFGYGEICWRDFEAILCGAVLVKPDMSHVETHPDLFVANQTYVPIRWDYSDLEETLRRLLSQPEEIQRIRETAFRALQSFFEGEQALARLCDLLGRAPKSPDTTSR